MYKIKMQNARRLLRYSDQYSRSDARIAAATSSSSSSTALWWLASLCVSFDDSDRFELYTITDM